MAGKTGSGRDIKKTNFYLELQWIGNYGGQ